MSEITQRIGLLSYIGSPLLLPTISRLAELGHQDVLVLLDGPKEKSKFIELIRDRTDGDIYFCRLEDLDSRRIAYHIPMHHNSFDCLQTIKRSACCILANCGTSKKLSEDLIAIPKFGVVNCHPGILPKYRGCSSVEWSLFNGDPVAATAHFMVKEYDAGPIIFVRQMNISGLTYKQIRGKMVAHQAVCTAEAVDQVLRSGKRPEEYPPQSDGTIWDIIPEDKLSTVSMKTY